MLRFVRQASVVLLSSLIGCGESTGPVSQTLNRVRWENQNLHEYGYIGRMSCFCGHSGEDVFVVVLADTVHSVTTIGTNTEVPKEQWFTVNELFDLARRSYERDGYERVRVEYHPELGYPAFIDLKCSADIVDCGLTIVVRDLGPLPTIHLSTVSTPQQANRPAFAVHE